LLNRGREMPDAEDAKVTQTTQKNTKKSSHSQLNEGLLDAFCILHFSFLVFFLRNFCVFRVRLLVFGIRRDLRI
jgi:hypothetical protein